MFEALKVGWLGGDQVDRAVLDDAEAKLGALDALDALDSLPDVSS
jgi:hypothetical protein